MTSPFQADARYRGVDEPRIIAMMLQHGWIHRFNSGERERVTGEAREHLNQLVRLGLPFVQTQEGARRFDPAEVLNFSKWASLTGRDAVWKDCNVETLRRSVLGHHAAEPSANAPPNPAALAPRRFSVTFEREFNLEGIAPRDTIRLRIPLPLESDSLREMTVRPYSPDPGQDDFLVAPGRLDAKLPMPRESTARLGAELGFTAYPVGDDARAPALSPAEIDLYTSASEGLIRVTPAVRSLAAQLAGAAREPWAEVQKFWDYLLDHKMSGIIHYDLLSRDHPMDWILDSPWLDCQAGSALLTALCRAQGIPARLVSGYVLYPPSPSEHYWTEIWIDHAWRPFDTACADLSVQGRDRAWRNHFFGRLDYRMQTQSLPRIFSANPVVRLPREWHLVTQPIEGGLEIGFYANNTGAFVYRDRLRV